MAEKNNSGTRTAVAEETAVAEAVISGLTLSTPEVVAIPVPGANSTGSERAMAMVAPEATAKAACRGTMEDSRSVPEAMAEAVAEMIGRTTSWTVPEAVACTAGAKIGAPVMNEIEAPEAAALTAWNVS